VLELVMTGFGPASALPAAASTRTSGKIRFMD
jgi:hypothetical protein